MASLEECAIKGLINLWRIPVVLLQDSVDVNETRLPRVPQIQMRQTLRGRETEVIITSQMYCLYNGNYYVTAGNCELRLA